MAPKLSPEYSKMLSTPVPPADGPRKDAAESLQKQIDFHVGEVYRLRNAQNSNAAVSCLPAELLAEAFLQVVESGLQDGKTHFATGTFSFVQVCKHWNKVAVGFPQLWRWWVAGAVKAWHLFNSRSRNTPLFLTWRPQLPTSARNILMDSRIPKRIHHLDFIGNSKQLARFLGAFESNPPSNASSIRLHISPYTVHEPRRRLSNFLSSSFPKLSQLDLGNFLPDPESPIFTTSNLTSLKLFFPDGAESCYSLFRLTKILQQHPNLQELDLSPGAMPLPRSTVPTSGLVPLVLRRLAILRLHGTGAAILKFMDLIDMSSPLHDVVIRFHRDFHPHAATVAKIFAAYYECQGLNYPRKFNHLTISYSSEKEYLIFNARSRSAPTSSLKSNLRFQFNGMSRYAGDRMIKETFPLFPLNDIREFAAEGSVICGDLYNEMFPKMKNVSHLRLENRDLFPALQALSTGNTAEPHQRTFPKLESLTLSDLDILFDCEDGLLGVLKERRDCNVGLRKLVIRSCRVHKAEYVSRLRELVKEVKWDNVEVVGSGHGDTEDDTDTDELEDGSEDESRDKFEDYHCRGCRC